MNGYCEIEHEYYCDVGATDDDDGDAFNAKFYLRINWSRKCWKEEFNQVELNWAETIS